MAKFSEPSVPVAELEYEHSPFERALIRYRKQLFLAAGVAIVGAAVYFGNKALESHRHESAAVAFSRANTVEEFLAAAEDNKGQPGGGNALLAAAQKLTEENKGREAVEQLRKFLADYPDHPLFDLAKFRLGDLLLKEGSRQDAEKYFREAGDGKSAFAPLAQLRVGDMLWEDGKTDDARRIYEQVITHNPGTGFFNIAEGRLGQIKQTPPTPVEFVPEPANAPAPGSPPSLDQLRPDISIPGLNLETAPGAAAPDTSLTTPAPPVVTPPVPTPEPAPAPVPAAPAAPAPVGQ